MIPRFCRQCVGCAGAFATDLDNPQPPRPSTARQHPTHEPPTTPSTPAAADLLDVLDTVLGQSRPDIHLDLGLGQTGQVGDRLAHLVLNLIEAPHPGDRAHVGGLQHPPVAAPPFGCHREYPSHRHHPFLTWREFDRPGETGE